MKSLNNKFFLILFLLLSISLFAQEQHYIQIVVSDTVTLKPIKFTYKITAENQYNYTYGKDTSKSVKINLQDIYDKLGKENFSERTFFNGYSVLSYGKDNEAILVTVSSRSELERLYEFVKDIKGASGKISNIEFEAPDQYIDLLFEHMYNKAKTQAGILAGKTGNEIGKVINVSEVKNQWEGLMDYYGQIEKNLSIEFLTVNNDFGKTYMRNLQFTFELK